MPGMLAVHVKCDECGYEWDYTGYRAMARCPNCEHWVYVAEMEEKEPTGTRVRCRH